MLEKGSYDFSFSGLKTAVLNYAHNEEQKGNEINKADLAASFQDAVVDVLVEKSLKLLCETGYDQFAISGGVAANSRLRERMGEELEKRDIKFYYPDTILCTDNAAMIAMAGHLDYLDGVRDNTYMKVYPNLDL